MDISRYTNFKHAEHSEDAQNRMRTDGLLFKECAASSRTVTERTWTAVSENWGRISAYFKKKETAIEASRALVKTYHSLSDDRLKTLHKECKALFLGFRKSMNNYGVVEGEVSARISVPDNVADTVAIMIKTMREESGYADGDGEAKGNPAGRQQWLVQMNQFLADYSVGVDKITPMEPEKRLRMFHAFLTGAAPGNPEYDPQMVDIVENLATHCFNQALKESEEERMFIESDDWSTAGATMTGWLEEAKEYKTKMEGNSGTGRRVQEANLDRLFHVLYIMWKVFKEKSISTQKAALKIMVRQLTSMLSKLKGEAEIVKMMSNGPQLVKAILGYLDLLSEGETRTHKYQHPLMISTKRFINGLTALTPIPFIAVFLNTLATEGQRSPTQPMIMLAYMFRRDAKIGERAALRDSLWLLHNYLKGVKSSAEYGGNVRGNALSVNIDITPGQRLDTQLTTYTEIATLGQMTDGELRDNLERLDPIRDEAF